MAASATSEPGGSALLCVTFAAIEAVSGMSIRTLAPRFLATPAEDTGWSGGSRRRTDGGSATGGGAERIQDPDEYPGPMRSDAVHVFMADWNCGVLWSMLSFPRG
jgi:hypothetical protein